MRILLIEDDPNLSSSLKAGLEQSGFVVDVSLDGQTGEFLGMTEGYDIAILDLGLPKISGLEVLRMWRLAGNSLPVIILTARDAWHEKVDGFKAGADDYLTKPFHTEELLARIHAVLKRLHGVVGSQISHCGLVLDESHQSVSIEGQQSVELTSMEFRLLHHFMLHPGQILSKSELLEHAYQLDSDPESNVIEVYINRLRSKLGKDLITTRRGQGYIFGAKT
jgi:DNA-binding response OmpR family regulator